MAARFIDDLRTRNTLARPIQGQPRIGGTGYRIYDTFMESVLPGIRSARSANRRYSEGLTRDEREFDMDEKQKDRDFTLYRDRVGQIADMQKMGYQNQLQNNKPMNVVFDDPDRLTRKEKEDIRLREMEIGRKSEWDEVRQALEGSKLDVAREKNEAAAKVASERNEIMRFKAENPNLKFQIVGTRVLAVDPQSGNVVRDLGDSGKLSDTDRITLQSDMRIREGQSTSQNRLGEIAATGEERRRTEAARPTPAAQVDDARVARATEFVMRNPQLAEFVTIDPSTNSVSIAETGTSFWGTPTGPTPEQRKQIADAILGTATPTTTTTTTETPTAADAKTGESDKRARAVEFLTKNRKPLTEANINFVMKGLK